MTDKKKIRAEVDRLKELVSDPILSGNDLMIGERNAYNAVLKFIDSLPEEPVSEDLEEEVDEYILDNFDDAEGRVYVLQCARHFANWQKQQMIKDAIDGVVICDEKLTHGYKDIVFKFPDNLQVGDKVKLIIIKED